MLSYCLKCREQTDGKSPSVPKANKGEVIVLSKCAVRDSKRLRFIKEQEASRFLTLIRLEFVRVVFSGVCMCVCLGKGEIDPPPPHPPFIFQISRRTNLISI